MTKNRVTPYVDPFHDIQSRHTICFVKDREMETFYWSTALKNVEPKMDYVAMPDRNKYLYALEDLGRGLSGRVWLCSTTSGRVCVLKSPNNKAQSGDHQSGNSRHSQIYSCT